MVVWTGTAGTRSNWRNMQRTVVRKQRQRVGHRGASWPPADAASADASNRTRHHHHTGVTIMAPHFLLDYVHSFFFWAASAQCQQDRAMPRTCRATTATGSLVFFFYFFLRRADCDVLPGRRRRADWRTRLTSAPSRGAPKRPRPFASLPKKSNESEKKPRPPPQKNNQIFDYRVNFEQIFFSYQTLNGKTK